MSGEAGPRPAVPPAGRRRLRPAYSDTELARIYAVPHDHRRRPEHRLRAAVTGEIAWWAAEAADAHSAADLSAGTGAVLDALATRIHPDRRYYGDLAPGHPICGPLEKTIEEIPPVDLFICTHTLELLDGPGAVLDRIRAKARVLVLSTPLGAWEAATDPERYWAWDAGGVYDMLGGAGFTHTLAYMCLGFTPGRPYTCGIWAVS